MPFTRLDTGRGNLGDSVVEIGGRQLVEQLLFGIIFMIRDARRPVHRFGKAHEEYQQTQSRQQEQSGDEPLITQRNWALGFQGIFA